jgi:hypothetical protein
MLEILNSLSIMVLDENDLDDDDEDEESSYNIYDSEDTWVPDENQDYTDDEWSSNEDES